MAVIIYSESRIPVYRPGGIIRVDRHGWPEDFRAPVTLARPKQPDYLAYNRLGLWLMFAFVMVALAGLFGLIS